MIALAARGARSRRNALALALAVPGVYLLTDVRAAGALIGFLFAFANAGLFATYIVLADRVAKRPELSGIDGLAAAMMIAAVTVTPIGGAEVVRAFGDPVALLAGVGVGVFSSVIPYVTDQLAMARLPRATYATLVALLSAIATIIGIVVLGQVPSWIEVGAIAMVMASVRCTGPFRAPVAAPNPHRSSRAWIEHGGRSDLMGRPQTRCGPGPGGELGDRLRTVKAISHGGRSHGAALGAPPTPAVWAIARGW